MTFAIIMNPIMYVNDWCDHIRCLSTFEKRSKLRIRSWVSLFIAAVRPKFLPKVAQRVYTAVFI